MSDEVRRPDLDVTRPMRLGELLEAHSGVIDPREAHLITQLARLERLIERPALLISEPRGDELSSSEPSVDEATGPLPALLAPSAELPQGVCSYTFTALYDLEPPSTSTLEHSLKELQQLDQRAYTRHGEVHPVRVHLASFNHLRALRLAHVQREVQAALRDAERVEEGRPQDAQRLTELRALSCQRLEELTRVQLRIDDRALLLIEQLDDPLEPPPASVSSLVPSPAPTTTAPTPPASSPRSHRARWRGVRRWRRHGLSALLSLLLHPGLWLTEAGYSDLIQLGGLWPLICLTCALCPVALWPAALVSLGLILVEPRGGVGQDLESMLGAHWSALPEEVTRWVPCASLLLIATLVSKALSSSRPLPRRVACTLPSALGSCALTLALLDQLTRAPLTLHSPPALFAPYILGLIPLGSALSGALKAHLTPLTSLLACATLVSPDLCVHLGLFHVSRWLGHTDHSLLSLLSALR